MHLRILITISLILFSFNGQAGIYSDDLSRCMVESTSKNDKVELVRWMFMSASLHPAVSSITSVSEEQLDSANRTTAKLVSDLLTEKCNLEAKKALEYEGSMALQIGFQVLGRVAARELFSSPEVLASIAKLGSYVDTAKLEGLLLGE